MIRAIRKEIEDALNKGKLIYGSNKTIESIIKGKAKKVVIARDCPFEIKEDILHYCELADIPCIEINLNSRELGTLCKRPHVITALAILKD